MAGLYLPDTDTDTDTDTRHPTPEPDTMPRSLAFAVLFVLAACGERTPAAGTAGDSASALNSSAVPAGDTFDLNIGGRAAAAGLVVAFTSVLEDSRCPEGAQCIQAGRARLTLRAEDSSGLSREVGLATFPDSASRDTAFGRVIRLLSLTPVPAIGVPVVQGDYTARLVVSAGAP